MKRNIIVLLVTAAILTACSGTAEPQQGTLISANEISENEISANESSSSENEVSENIADAERVSEAVSEGSTETESTEDAEGEENVSEDDGTYEYLDVSLDYYQECAEEAIVEYNLINFGSTNYSALEESINQFNEEMQTEVQELLESQSDLDGISMESETMLALRRMDSVVFSVEIENASYYQGAARHNVNHRTLNLDSQTGEEILLESVVTDMNRMYAVLITELLENHEELSRYSAILENEIRNQQSSLIWTLGYEGVTFYFNPYGIGPGASSYEETILYKEYPDIYNEFYFSGIQNDYVMNFPRASYTSLFCVDLNNDDIQEYVGTTERDFGETRGHVVYISDVGYKSEVTYRLEVGSYYMDMYYVKAGDEHYLYVGRMTEDGCYLVSVFAVTANTIDYVGDFEGELQYFSNSSSFQICRPVDFLGSYNVIMECCVDDTGMPVAIQDRHIIADEVVLTSTAEIEAELIDEDGNLLRTSYVFPVGTRFTLKVTNAESNVEAETSDGRRCILYVNQGTTTMVNGYDATTVFDLE